MAKANLVETDHWLDTSIIDALDDDGGGEEQCALVWCNTHQRFEWHYIDRMRIGATGIIRRTGRAATR